MDIPSRAKIPAPKMASETGMVASMVVLVLDNSWSQSLRFRTVSLKRSNNTPETPQISIHLALNIC